MSRSATAIALWLQQHVLRQRHSVIRETSLRSARFVVRCPLGSQFGRHVHSDARRSSNARSSYQPVASLLPNGAYDALVSRLGQQQTHRELHWLLEQITATPLATLRSHHASLSPLIRSLPAPLLSALHSLVEQRASGVPLQYLLGDVRWCGLSVLCRPPTLIPRPETEEMVDWLCGIVTAPPGQYTHAGDWPTTPPHFEHSITARPVPAQSADAVSPLRALDLCTGSGCISLALAAHLHCTTLGTDLSHDALHLARDNTAHVAQQLGGQRTLRSAFQYDDLRESRLPAHAFDLVVSNPPYIATAELATLQTEVRLHESPLALDGGADGTELYKHVAALAARVLRPLGVEEEEAWKAGWPELVVEIGGAEQVARVMDCFRAAGFVDCAAFADRAGRMRWIAGKRR